MKIAIGSDHAGFELKEKIKAFLEDFGHNVLDLGCYSKESVDYPEFGVKVAQAVLNKEAERGILICGTGLGMSMVANRFRGIRAALCHELFTTKMARLHNDANVLVLGGRVIGEALALEMVKVFIDTPFGGGRHERRIKLIDELTKE
ncbi:sugar-phosphate isomerase, RpiB/LacA/LacB family [Thermodesulfatator indicus DSM 15286]|uniref:Sugar-phosphate isomerase, RpiB/LacA/LacB family n=1 Tax=Thermodesulfatator indicus (strain DSM 15286 / JCM 11887 / CIR29812) TaxID=667014 RepID=F8AAC5_THEID|nr:ribose 5-phosphate isomerase B [Thermodesulfatator indicus]AEH44262.1 sugar-phosphate isomerase, RpiB/LacA/LacB family [Thermodesulfatator indicus DSM 15286]